MIQTLVIGIGLHLEADGPAYGGRWARIWKPVGRQLAAGAHFSVVSYKTHFYSIRLNGIIVKHGSLQALPNNKWNIGLLSSCFSCHNRCKTLTKSPQERLIEINWIDFGQEKTLFAQTV